MKKLLPLLLLFTSFSFGCIGGPGIIIILIVIPIILSILYILSSYFLLKSTKMELVKNKDKLFLKNIGEFFFMVVLLNIFSGSIILFFVDTAEFNFLFTIVSILTYISGVYLYWGVFFKEAKVFKIVFFKFALLLLQILSLFLLSLTL